MKAIVAAVGALVLRVQLRESRELLTCEREYEKVNIVNIKN